MRPGNSFNLTARQQAVIERIDRRVPIKVIAAELSVSETRINQHIRALKDIYGATSLGELVELYRANSVVETDDDDQSDEALKERKSRNGPLSEDAYRKTQVPLSVFDFDTDVRDEERAIEFEDVTPLIERAPWLRPGEPKVVPGMLDGEHAVTLRLAAIVGIAFGLLAAAVLTATAAIMISDALNERAAVPVDEQGFT